MTPFHPDDGEVPQFESYLSIIRYKTLSFAPNHSIHLPYNIWNNSSVDIRPKPVLSTEYDWCNFHRGDEYTP